MNPYGNGRWSRMLGDIWLLRHGGKPIPWPADLNGESPIRDEYLQALRRADDHDLESMLDLCRRLATPPCERPSLRENPI